MPKPNYIRAVGLALGLAGSCLVGPGAQGVDLQPDLNKTIALNENVIDGDVFLLPGTLFVGQVKITDEACDVDVVTASRLVSQAANDPQVDGHVRLNAADFGCLRFKVVQGDLDASPVVSLGVV